MTIFSVAGYTVEPTEDSTELENAFMLNAKTSLAGIQFDNSYSSLTDLKDIKQLEVSIRFPAELRKPYEINQEEAIHWSTMRLYPGVQQAGPRLWNSTTGAYPNYYEEGFLMVQQLLVLGFMYARDNSGDNQSDNIAKVVTWKDAKGFPSMYMQRFPHSSWYSDPFNNNLKLFMPIMTLFVFMPFFVNTVQMIVLEKEMQLKEFMKIMGLTKALYWVSWFLLCFIYMLIIIIIFLILLSVPLLTKNAVFTYSDPLLMLFFLMAYGAATIAFAFIFCVLFSKATKAAMVCSVAWILPMLFFRMVSSSTTAGQIAASLCSNVAMSLGFETIFSYEIVGEGSRWSNLFRPDSAEDDDNTLGYMILMLIFDTFLYILIALYLEELFPGENGVRHPWNFPCRPSYWRSGTDTGFLQDYHAVKRPIEKRKFFEAEPKGLKVGVKLRNLTKVYESNKVVNDVTLNICEDQITEHLYFYSRLRGLSAKQTQTEVEKSLASMQLVSKKKVRASKLSGGMKRRLCVCLAFCGNSKIVLLDEPTSGMDPNARRALWNLMVKHKKGKTIILTTHFLDEADVLGDRIAIMSGGELKCCGSSFFLKKRFGSGYTLTIDKGPSCDVSHITSLLKSFVPEVKLTADTETEATYLLPENRASSFEAMLKELERKSISIGVQSYGISLTTMEDVFMKFKAMQRSWILWVIQFLLPAFFVLLDMFLTGEDDISHLPVLPLTLRHYGSPITLVEHHDDPWGYYESYKGLIQDEGYTVQDADIDNKALQLTEETPSTFHRRYIIGANFKSTESNSTKHPVVGVWFNNNPLHTPPLALGYALSAIFRKMASCIDCGISFTNAPFPVSEEFRLKRIESRELKRHTIEGTLGDAFNFTAAFYILFLIKENACKSRHLQHVAGIRVFIFWLMEFLFDFATHIVVCRLFVIFLYFGWAVFPLIYLAAYCFKVPASGFVTVYLIFMFTALTEAFRNFNYKEMCDERRRACEEMGIGLEQCFKMLPDKIREICSSLILFILLFLIEYGILTRLGSRMVSIVWHRYPSDEKDIDDDVALVRDRVNRYECFGLLGVNGAGKTSTFKMMTGDVRMTHGQGWVQRFSIRSEIRKVHTCIGYCPQFDALLDDMTGRETIIMYALIKGYRYPDACILAENLSDCLDFREHLDKQVKKMSGGNKRKLSAAVAMVGEPVVLFFDEPTSGMDPATKYYFRDVVRHARDNGKCIILTSHYLEECEALCTRLAIMVNGSFKCLGSVQHLKSKFANGCTITIKVKRNTTEDGITAIQEYIKDNLPSAQLSDRHQELLTGNVSDPNIPWSRIFSVLEGARNKLKSIEDYSIAQGSLEQVNILILRQLLEHLNFSLQ
nr:unnamed protein product [Callosobruchus analis]